MNTWVLLPEWKTCSSVVALTAFERRSFTSPMKRPQRGWDSLTRPVKHLWLPPLSGCVSPIPPAANCLYWSSSCLHLLYGLWDNGAERLWNTGQCVLYVRYLRSSSRDAPRNAMWDPSLLRKLSQAISFALHNSMSLPDNHTLKGLFVFASRCICVAWVSSLLHLCHTDFHCKQDLSVKMCVQYVCVHMLIQPFQCTHAGVHTSVLQPRLRNLACVFHPSVDSGKAAAPQWPSCLLFCNESVPLLRIRLQPTWLSMGNCWD